MIQDTVFSGCKKTLRKIILEMTVVYLDDYKNCTASIFWQSDEVKGVLKMNEAE